MGGWNGELNIDTYVHRIGRTGRAGKLGRAYTFVETIDRGIPDLVRLLTEAGQRIPIPLRDVEIDERIPLKKKERKFEVFLQGEDGEMIEVNPEKEEDPKGKGRRRKLFKLKGKSKGKGKDDDKGKGKGKGKEKGKGKDGKGKEGKGDENGRGRWKGDDKG